MCSQEYLRMHKITKKFGNFIANQDVDFTVRKGEVHALLGENGAGKSTLMNILAGLYRMNSGEIYLDGKLVEINSPQDAKALGIGMVYQHFMLVEAMTVTENIMLSIPAGSNILNFNQIRNRIIELSDKYGLEVQPDKLVADLSVGEQQRIEIIKALYADAKLLILDEPTAVLTPQETEGLFSIVRQLTKEGHTIIFISHKLKEVMEICDRITILRKGEKVAEVDKVDTSVEELGNLMVGRTVLQEKWPVSSKIKEPMVTLKDVTVVADNGIKKLDIASLEVHAGEILGIAGVDGNGQSELAKVVTGLEQPTGGEITILGEGTACKSVRDFIDMKISHIPEDRNRMGLIGEMSIFENLVLKNIEEPPYSSWNGWRINYQALHQNAANLIGQYDIRTSGDTQKVNSLSGGNQQKVILAREMESSPKFLVAVHPTRGVDIGASEYIHKQILQARDNGCAVLFISADLDEVLRMADRIAVIYEGKIMGYENALSPNINRIGLMMAGKEEIDAKQ